MGKRVIKATINPDGTVQINNAGNPDVERILRELGDLAKVLTGDSKGFEIEKHVHTHATAHEHTHADGTVHSH
jgi:hypothetical protein